MNRHMIYGLGLGLALVLTAPTYAQGGVLYSPTAYDTKTEGELYGYYFVSWPNSRRQMVDGENKGKVAVIGAINLRLDYRSHTSTTTAGRKWTNVKVTIGEGNINKLTTTFASNFTSTPTTVFNNSWSLPTVTGSPSTSPAVYGGAKGEYRIPFSSTWVYTGKADIIHDWQFSGGTLDNNVAWATNSGRTYYFDGYRATSEYSAAGSTYRYIPSTRLNNNSAGVTTRCNDSSITTTTGSYTYVYATLYGSKYVVLNYRSSIYFYTRSYYTAPNAPVIHALAFATDNTGVDVRTGCNRLHLKGPMILRPMMTMPRSYSSYGYSEYRIEWIPWVAAMANLKIAVQGAWSDSVTKRFNLTQAREAILPSSLPGPLPQRQAIYTYQGANASTALGITTSYAYNPIFAFSSK